MTLALFFHRRWGGFLRILTNEDCRPRVGSARAALMSTGTNLIEAPLAPSVGLPRRRPARRAPSDFLAPERLSGPGTAAPVLPTVVEKPVVGRMGMSHPLLKL